MSKQMQEDIESSLEEAIEYSKSHGGVNTSNLEKWMGDLVEKIEKDEVSIITKSLEKEVKSQYIHGSSEHIKHYKDQNGTTGMIQINISQFKENVGTDFTINALEKAKDGILLLLLLAHEYGHHLDKELPIDLVEKRNNGLGHITICEKKRIYECEKRAASNAKKELDNVGFTEWDRFEKEEEKRLKTYKPCLFNHFLILSFTILKKVLQRFTKH